MNVKSHILISVMLVFLLATGGPLCAGARAGNEAPGNLEQKVDRIIERVMDQHAIPGLTIGVVDGGRVVLQKGYGVKWLPEGPPPDKNTVFALGSVSKALTAVGAMLLVEEGRIRLDDPIRVYLNDLPIDWQRITVRQFMTHTSGIPDFPKSRSFEVAVARAAREPMQFDPGSMQKYTNANFAVIGKLIEAVSGQDYLVFMHQRVFEPLGMNATGSYMTHLRGDHAVGYRWQRERPVPGNLSVARYGIPSGGLVSNLADMLKLDSALRENRLMKPETRQMMYTMTIPPHDEHPWKFTPGWQARIADGELVVAKNGMVVGYASMYQMVPRRGISVIMLWDLSGNQDDLWAATEEILFECFGISKKKVREREAPAYEP
jgi:CubicO group peptidase (beta-lactamase class C family)